MYQVEGFQTDDTLTSRINKWLAEHPDIRLACQPMMSGDVLLIWYEPAPPKELDPNDMLIDDLGLKTKHRNCLLRGGVRSVNQALTMSDEDLRGVRDLGRTGVDELIRSLIAIGKLDSNSRLGRSKTAQRILSENQN